MGYLIYEGRTKQEALDKMKLAAIQENRMNETHFIRTCEKEVRKWFGFKKETRWNAIVYVNEHKTQSEDRRPAAVRRQAQPALFPKEQIEAAAAPAAIEKAVKLMQAKAVPAPRTRELEDKVEKLESSLETLQSFIKNEFATMREGLIQSGRNQELERENRLVQDIEIGKQNIAWADNLLREREFHPQVITDIIEHLKVQKNDILIDKAQILTTIRNFLKTNIVTEDISLDSYKPAKHVLFVGPTGVGKTVSLVKMAAHVAAARQKTARFISIDRYKLGADAQLKIWADLMQSECHPINEQKDFFQLLDKPGAHYTFIDTAGKSPRETIVIKELKDWIEKASRPFDIHLVVSATTKPRDLDLIIENYGMIDYSHILATKLDETVCLGSIVSVLYKTKKPLSFISNGQQVPMDFEIANVDKLIADALK